MPGRGSRPKIVAGVHNAAMASPSLMAQSGMRAAQLRLDASAHNIANLQTRDFHRQEVQQQTAGSGGVDASIRVAPAPGEALANDRVEQKMATYAFKANLKVIQTEKQMLAHLLDERA